MAEALNPDVPAEFTACTICHQIWLKLTDSGSSDSTLIGSFEQGLSDGCPNHAPLLEAFRDHLSGFGVPIKFEDIGIEPDATLVSSLKNGGAIWRLLLANTASSQNSAGQGRILDPDWADLTFLRECKRKCLLTHGGKCDNPMRISPVTPLLLIDVQNNCLVSGNEAGPYVALSYVWGTSSSPRRFNVPIGLLQKLKQSNGLDSLEAQPYVSPIVRRAIALTSLIGERWLWVDVLCVPQGDFEVAAEQINMMGAIFGGAVMTIVSADGNAESGLKGLEGISPSRELDQTIIPFGSERIVVGQHDIFSWDGDSPYHDRAWTYQEFKMSPRTIWFLDKLVSWKCQCSVWDEERMFESSLYTYIDPRPKTILAGIPDVPSIGHILSDYNNRQLTYPEDTLLGIQGFLSVLSRSFEGGFLYVSSWYGLPETHFDRFLGWHPYWGRTNLKRRVRSDRPNDALIGPSELPSWSWVGWQGLIDIGVRYDATYFNPSCERIAETIPIVTWYTSESPSDPNRRKITPTFLENIPKFKEAGSALPPGWTRVDNPPLGEFRGEPNIYPDGCGDYFYSHANLMKLDEENWFYYPFPVVDITEDTPPVVPPQTAYLFCETQKGRLHAKPQKNPPLGEEMEKCILDFRDENSTIVGKLHLHNKEQLSLFTGSNAPGENSPGNEVEVVAISKRREYAKTWNEELERYDHPITAENWYVVLWVEWVDHVAYRLASGTVEEKAWEKLNRENVSLVLG
ncbi:heterokaryon incompatibility protein-domain-containing protein [Xylaria telfairii]|nr:heterokaryon incompatibility protein-domain-containing protein [Xylaria telfairii]